MQRYLKVFSPHGNYFVNLHADKQGGVRVYAPPEKETRKKKSEYS